MEQEKNQVTIPKNYDKWAKDAMAQLNVLSIQINEFSNTYSLAVSKLEEVTKEFEALKAEKQAPTETETPPPESKE